MKIIKTKDHAALKVVFPAILEYMNNERCQETPDQFIMWLRVNLQSPLTCFWVAMGEDNKVLGYCVAVVQQLIGGKESLAIVQLFGESEEIEDELMNVVEKWKNDYRIPTLVALTPNKDKFERLGMQVEEYKLVIKGE
jgi:hypothetical protein